MASMNGLAVLLAVLPAERRPRTQRQACQRRAPAATAPATDAAVIAEEIAVLRAVKPLRTTSEQLAALTAAVSAAHDRLVQQAKTTCRR